jgi:lactate dehydrogenase-like 2-hydroxyacid dehydrogenase
MGKRPGCIGAHTVGHVTFMVMEKFRWDLSALCDMEGRDDEIHLLIEVLRSLLPKSCKIYASAGAGFDWVDTKTMAEHGMSLFFSIYIPNAQFLHTSPPPTSRLPLTILPGVIYCNSAPACTESVADCAIVLILSTFRAIVWSFLGARSLSVPAFQDANQNIAAVTHNPNGHTLGIIGLGKIG